MKIHPKRMIEFLADYDASALHMYAQRFGQAFCNEFGLQDNKLFYQENRNDAEEYIWLFYIE